MSKVDEVFRLIADEVHKAEEKFPWWPDDLIHGAAIVAEESGELIQATLQNKYEKGGFSKMKIEAIQTGAMAVRFLIDLSKRDGWEA